MKYSCVNFVLKIDDNLASLTV